MSNIRYDTIVRARRKMLLVALGSLFLFVSNVESVDPFFYPLYHLAPPGGWMNDPNGFCFYDGHYHLYYQYNPDSSEDPGRAHWGHAISKDLVYWTHLPVAMKPDKPYDKDGVFSGSAIVHNNTMYLLYTGNVNHKGETPDHEQHQALAWTQDGVNVTKYENNPIIEGANRQPNFRDPKVWKHGDTYYMVLGNSYNNDTLGRVLLYSSKDLIHWKEISILDQSYGFLGYMWECPDFFEMDGYFVLLFSPQGMKSQGIKYNNLYQTGYLVGYFDYEYYKFTPVTEFKELDSGHDFYATQTMETESGERILMAWNDMWENKYPERKAGFTGQMTIPRAITLDRELRLIQRPVSQIHKAFGEMVYNGNDNQIVLLENNTGMIKVTAPGHQDFIMYLEVDDEVVATFSYNYDDGLATLDRGGEDGIRSTKWRPRGLLHLSAYVDRSSIEIFLGQGEATFSSRIFPKGKLSVRVSEHCDVEEFKVYSIKQTVPTPPSD